MVLSRAEETCDFARISQTLKNLFFPVEHTLEGIRDNIKRDMNNAEHHHDFVKDHAGHTWVQDDQGYWYEWSDEQHSYVCYDDSSETHDDSDAFLLEDAVDEWMAEEDPSYNESLVTMRQSRDTMNRLRSARGFFKGKIDGVLEESSGPGMRKGKGKGKTKGKRQRTKELWSYRPRVCRLPADAGRWWIELFQHRSTKPVDAEIEWEGQRRRSKRETTIWHVGYDSRSWTPGDTSYSNTQKRT